MRGLRFLTLAIMTCAAMCCSSAAFAVSTITVHNLDGAGEGFNDPTPFASVGGNPAATVGQARLIAFQFAANIWGSTLTSHIEIQIDARFDPLTCSATSAILGQAGPTTAHRNFFGAPLPNTWYPQALANSIAGFDLNPIKSDITATFNSDLDNAVCLGGTKWYYGLDGKPPAGDIDLVTVVLHELGHGLGFTTFVDLASGARMLGQNDTYMLNLENHGATVPLYPNMTDAQRVAASTADPNLHWVGASVNAEAAVIPLTGGVLNGHVRMYGPAAQEPGSSVSHFSTALFPNQLMEPAYTGPNHNVGLTAQLMQDIGWTLQDKFGTDVVFIMDITGSTGALVPGWSAQIPTIAQSWLDVDPNARFAVVSHADYPFDPYGTAPPGTPAHPTDWAFRMESALSSNLANLTNALNGLQNLGHIGGDDPESQYEAIYQVLKPEGRDLNHNSSFLDQGDFFPQNIGQLYPMVIYHFTWPVMFHDRDLEPDYPCTGCGPVPGKTAVDDLISIKSNQDMYFGLTFITGGLGKPAYVSQVPGLRSSPFATASEDPMAALARLSGGLVLDTGAGLENLQQAIDSSIVHWAGSPQDAQDDPDGDGVALAVDNCPNTFNPGQEDFDGDGVGDACDNCRRVFNPGQTDADSNGVGNLCEAPLAVPARAAEQLAFGRLPNPILNEGVITFFLPAEGSVRLELFDAAGRRVRTLLNEVTSAGAHSARFDGRDDGGRRLGPGVYMAHLSLNGADKTQRIVLLH